MNKRYTPTCFFAHIGVYQHRSPSVPETGKRQRGYVYPQRIGCGEHRFNRGFAPLEQSIGKPGIDTGLGGKVVGVPGMVRGLFTEGGCDIRFGAGEKSPAFTRRLETAEVTRVLQLRLCRLRQVIVQIRLRRPP